MTHKCIQLAEAKPWHWNKSTALNSDGILRGEEKKKGERVTQLPFPGDKLAMMNAAIRKMTCLKCQTVASVF